jgi:hypothetical protein
MELRHLRYFLAVGEALNFRKAAAQLRLAQPALSRQVQDLEDEIGVDLFRRSPRGVTLTAEGKLFLKEAREVLKHADESVERARALARGEYGELHIGYSAIPTEEILPAALEAFRRAVPRVKVLLHDSRGTKSLLDCTTPRWNSRLWPAGRGDAGTNLNSAHLPVVRALTTLIPLPAEIRLVGKLATEPSSVSGGITPSITASSNRFSPRSPPNRASRWNATASVR